MKRVIGAALMGAALVLALRILPAAPARARATLYFPPARPLDWRHNPAEEIREEPRDWARSLLSSVKAGEQIRRVLEPQATSEAAIASSLLNEGNHLQLQTREPGLLDLEVSYDKPQVSLLICQAMVAFLKSEILVERSRRVDTGLTGLVREQADALERQERAEHAIVSKLREHHQRPTRESYMGIALPDRDPVDALMRQDFQAGLAATRRLRSRELSLALKEETGLPGICVLEPPHLDLPERPGWYTPVAALLGILLGTWAGPRLLSRSKAHA